MIIYSGPLTDLSGYASASRSYVKALFEAGINIKVHVVNYDVKNHINYLDPDLIRLVRQLSINDEDYTGLDYKFLSHATPSALFVPREAKFKIAYSVWETDKVLPFFKQFLDRFDIILTASEFSRQAFLTTLPYLNIEVVPHIIYDRTNRDDIISPESINEKVKDKFVYFWNSEWITGKGPDILLDCFLKAFKDNKDVVLLIKTYNLSMSNYKDSILNYIKNKKSEIGCQYPSIIPVIGDIHHKDLLGLYKLANIFISTSRRDAWNLCASEAFGFGIPVVAANKGGHTEFLNNKNSILVDSYWDDVKNLEPNRILYKGQKWIEMNQDDLIDKLKYTYENSDLIDQNEWKKTINKFNSHNIVKKFLDFI